MQVPPNVPSPDPEQPSDQAKGPIGSIADSSTGPWLVFAFILLALLIAILSRPEPRSRLPIALLTTISFSVLARTLRGVTVNGAVAGCLVTLICFLAGGGALFGAILLVFALTYVATRIGRQRKRSLSIAERAGGRDGAQVLANIGCAALAAAAAVLTPWHPMFLAGSVAALAEAASDTVSSETGKALARTARLITSGQIVGAGADGAISVQGTLAGLMAAAAIGIEACATDMLSLRLVVAATVSGILGMFLDSLLGATAERKGWITNNGVNLTSTAFSVVAGMLLSRI